MSLSMLFLVVDSLNVVLVLKINLQIKILSVKYSQKIDYVQVSILSVSAKGFDKQLLQRNST